MKGKEKCKALKEIRRQIAEKNDIPFAVSQCTHQGDCKGTCPKCESELRYLERELAIRQGLGKAVAIAGISIGACTAFTACSPKDTVSDFLEGIGIGNGYRYGQLTGADEPIPDDELGGATSLFDWETAPEETPEPEIGETSSEAAGELPPLSSPDPEETVPAIEGDISIAP